MVAAALAASAQTATTIHRIGLFSPRGAETQADLDVEAAPLRARGWVEGQNLFVERRYANGRPELLRSLAEELVRLKVEIIVTRGTAATLAAKDATTTHHHPVRMRPNPRRSGREPIPAWRQYHRLFHCWPRA
jgi:putative ABC transport system substrate-binding protein